MTENKIVELIHATNEGISQLSKIRSNLVEQVATPPLSDIEGWRKICDLLGGSKVSTMHLMYNKKLLPDLFSCKRWSDENL